MNFRLSSTRLVVGLFVLAAACVSAGCATERVTYDNYTMIRQHHTQQREVLELLGEPNQRMGDQWYYWAGDDVKHMIIDFDESGRVVRKQWIDAADEAWDDSQDRS